MAKVAFSNHLKDSFVHFRWGQAAEANIVFVLQWLKPSVHHLTPRCTSDIF